ncbi:FAD-binding oxidoreductase [Halomonas sp. H10-59]|uniref:FAD-binding oxidoreductase n=1 Tax=Halomonas sp. H10-59 TaxID=2950874 RepID=A0AAU7KY72_9GAMM
MNTIAVVGAGIVGLAVARSLAGRGHRVQLFDPGPPGEGTSFGNAGLIANYATSPMASIDTLRQLPGELCRRDASLSVDPRYLARLAGFGPRFLKAATPSRFAHHKSDLVALIQDAVKAQHALLESLEAPDLYADTGCLQLARQGDPLAATLEASARAKRADGVACEVLTAQEVRDLEPVIHPADLVGGLYFPETRHLKDSLAVSQALWKRLKGEGVVQHGTRIKGLVPLAAGGWRLICEDGEKGEHGENGENGENGESREYQADQADQVVLCAGIANDALLKSLGVSLPVVSERGYHVRLETPLSLSRPVGWLARHFYATPMHGGVRLAGTTEFTAPDRAADERRWERLKGWGEALFGRPLSLAERWMGVRHSTPDGLPVVGQVTGREGLFVAYGHGHLGLTQSAHTGELIAAMIHGEVLPDYVASLSPARF